MKARVCRRCGRRVKLFVLLGTDDELALDEGVYVHPRRPAPTSLFVYSLGSSVHVERAEAETMRRRKDGSRGPFLAKHSERCE